MFFPPLAVERAMKVKDVLVRAISGEYTWWQAAEILGMSLRSVRRWRLRMERHGYTGLIDMRRGVPSPRRAPVAEVQRIVGLYRDTYRGYNARHFYQTVKREHGVRLSYSLVRQLLQSAGLMKKGRARGRHRMRRPRRARFGEMLHLDGSPHCWLALVPEEKQTLIQVVDDATSRLLYAQLWPGETTRAVMTAMREIVREHGIPESFYTDRAGWAFDTPKAGGKVSRTNLTQVGEVLARLGVEHIPSYSPQARGRSERMNRTLQGRLVNELRVAQVTALEAANEYLRERYLPTHNEEFAKPSADSTSAFVELGDVDLDEVFYEEAVRKVGKDNTVGIDGVLLQVEKQAGRRTCSGLSVQVRRHLDGGYTVRRGAQRLGAYDAYGRPRPPAAGKTTHQDRPGSTQQPRVDSRLVQAISTYRSSRGGGGRARVPVSGRLRLPPTGTPSSRMPSKACESGQITCQNRADISLVTNRDVADRQRP
jgi:transposase